MPKYLLLSTLTPEGRKTVHQQPDRIATVNDEIRAFHCEVVMQYALLGPYDFMTLVEAPDNETIAHLSVDLGSRGAVTILTMPAIELPALVAQLQGPDQLGRGVDMSGDITAATPGEDFAGRSTHF